MPYKNPEDQKKAARRHYIANRAAMIRRAHVFTVGARKRNKAFIQSYLSTHPCVDCGEADLVVLEFDHVRGDKREAVANLSGQAVSIQTLEQEISKCEVRCANCHRRMTHKRRLEGHATVAEII